MDSIIVNKQLKELSKTSISKFVGKIKNIDKYYRFDIGLPRLRLKELIGVPLDIMFNNIYMDYSPAKGLYSLRETISKMFKDERGITYSPEEVLVCCGSLGAIYSALKAILNPGDKVLVPLPAWPTYENLIKINSGQMITIDMDLNKEYLELDIEAVDNAIQGDIKAVIINNPHNPTGMMYSPENIRQIINYACRNNIYVLIDEAYHNIIYDDKVIEKTPYIKHPNILYFRTFSKYYGVPGLRLGYVLGNLETLEAVNTVNHLTVGNIDKITQYVGLNLLTSSNTYFEERVRNYKKWIQKASEIIEISDCGMKILQIKGTYYIFARLPEKLDFVTYCQKLLTKYKTIVLPGSIFGKKYHNYIRLSLTENEDKMLKGLENVVECVVSMKK
ncbi:pyridoxal phosphate-dependent aminotransferase [Paramaledivibacter caminithermalis]|jgi:aspartate/methionine/tyrosine aminotransferase|uniref:Aminotransferase class I and II n=1 Tax=Paramaledivibacter caminithermalis (strain DSM 15212 / CIP 107654 / DViRD3) TaxID=1121301 RepID=A0A1M6QG31_PARC5|nr:pyridoxal phosphate-dependent aminotransferase [Paramaledivibacter caminithermalis]SHK19135.1 Aminotransferase class I and II [Paramaledivibacter caminithermalis DSM 15212]